MINHRAECRECRRVWRENCEDCLHDDVARHRRETGHHQIDMTITQEQDNISMWELRELTARAGQILYGGRRGW